MAPLVSFNLASNRPEGLAGLFDNLERTADDPTCFEVLVLTDLGDRPMAGLIARESARRPFAIKALPTPPEGYFNLWRGLNRLHRELCDPDATYVCNINDEIRFTSTGWDAVLRRWIGVFPDGLFRLRISRHKLHNYRDPWECGYAPENYAFSTRAWIDISGGDWNPCHGPDSFQQYVAWYLAKAYYPAKATHCRDIPIFDVEIAGEGAFLGLDEKAFWDRMRRGWVAWYRLVGHEMQTEANRRAHRLHAHIMATRMGYEDFGLADDRARSEIVVTGPDGKALLDSRGEPMRYRYRLSRLRIGLRNLWRRPMQNYWCGGGPEVLRETILNIPFNLFPPLKRIRGLLRPFYRPVLRAAEAGVRAAGWLRMQARWAMVRRRSPASGGR